MFSLENGQTVNEYDEITPWTIEKVDVRTLTQLIEIKRIKTANKLSFRMQTMKSEEQFED